MAKSLNKIQLIGNLGGDVDYKQLDGGSEVAKFSLATSENYKKRDGSQVDDTQWHNCVAWRGLAGVCSQYLSKGSKVYVEGKLKTRSFKATTAGGEEYTKYATEIIIDDMLMLGGDRGGGSGSFDSGQQQEQPSFKNASDDDLPF